MPQPHGGALLSGGLPGHRGGSGRPRSEFRKIARGDYELVRDEMLRVLEEREPCPTCKRRLSDSDLARFGDHFSKLGGLQTDYAYDERLVTLLGDGLAAVLHAEAPDEADALLGAVKRSWVKALGAYVRGD